MPPKRTSNAGSPSRVKKKSNTQRGQDSRKADYDKAYERLCGKSFLFVVEHDSYQLPELVLSGPHPDANLLSDTCTLPRGHFNHSHDDKSRVIAGPTANRDVLQFYGLTMPGVTVVEAPAPASNDEAPQPPTRGVPRFPSTQRMTRRQQEERQVSSSGLDQFAVTNEMKIFLLFPFFSSKRNNNRLRKSRNGIPFSQ